MTRAAKKNDTKHALLEAALELVRKSGATALTLDAVAQEAGFSKGGLLYNFPTKDALITGMVEHLARQFEEAIESGREEHSDSPSPTLAAMIDVCEDWLRQQREITRALLPTTASKPELVQPFMEVERRLKSRVSSETEQLGVAWTIWTSLQGLHFSEAHCVSIFSESERAIALDELRNRLNEMNS